MISKTCRIFVQRVFESPEVINTTQGLFRVDDVEIYDCIDADGDGVACENLEAKELKQTGRQSTIGW